MIRIVFREDNSIHVEGMLYSQYAWALNLSNRISVEEPELRLENPIVHMNAPVSLRDVSLTADSICIINPDFRGEKPTLPNHCRNRD